MATVIQQPSIFGQNFQEGIGALAQGLQQRGENQRQAQYQSALDEALARGESDPIKLLPLAKGAGVDQGALMKAIELKQPSLLDQMLEQKKNQIIRSEEDQIAENMGVKEPYNPLEDKNLYQQFSDDEIAALAGSKSQKDQKFAETIHKQKKEERKKFVEDREFHTKISDKYDEQMQEKLDQLDEEEMALKELDLAFASGELSAGTWSDLGNRYSIFKGFVTPEGAISNKAIKDYFVSTLKNIKAKGQNVFAERIIASSLPELGKSDEANEIIIEGLKQAHKLKKIEADEYTKLKNEYMDSIGYVPRNIKDIVKQKTNSEKEAIINESNYRMREIIEKSKTDKELEKLINKKVPQDTPLTKRMFEQFKQKFGDKAEKQAKLRGYKIINSAIEEKNKKSGFENEVIMMYQGKKIGVPQDQVEKALQSGATQI